MLNNYIGGPIELTLSHLESKSLVDINEQLGIINKTFQWTSSGRSGLALLLESWFDELIDGWILLPDYMCWESTLPVFNCFQYQFISVDEELNVNQNELKEFMMDDSLRSIYLIDYFGVCDLNPQINLIREIRPDILIIIDAVQAFCAISVANERYANADAIITGPRKVIPIPDGGLVIVNNNTKLPSPPLTEDSNERVAFYLSAGMLRHTYIEGRYDEDINTIIEPLYLNLYSKYNNLIKKKIEAISPLSIEILNRTDLELIAKKRSNNYSWFQESIRMGRGSGLIRSALPNASGPGLAFPIKVNSKYRNRLRTHLNEQGYFCPIHWPTPLDLNVKRSIVSSRLSGELLSLPIDQRYGFSDLEQLLQEIEKFRDLYTL